MSAPWRKLSDGIDALLAEQQRLKKEMEYNAKQKRKAERKAKWSMYKFAASMLIKIWWSKLKSVFQKGK